MSHHYPDLCNNLVAYSLSTLFVELVSPYSICNYVSLFYSTIIELDKWLVFTYTAVQLFSYHNCKRLKFNIYKGWPGELSIASSTLYTISVLTNTD